MSRAPTVVVVLSTAIKRDNPETDGGAGRSASRWWRRAEMLARTDAAEKAAVAIAGHHGKGPPRPRWSRPLLDAGGPPIRP